MLRLETEEGLCFGLGQLVVVGKTFDTLDVALALGLREGGHEFVHGEVVFGAVAAGAGGDDVVDAAGAAHGARDDVVVGDGLDGERCAAIDAAAVGFVGEDGEGARIAPVFFQGFSAPQEGEILQEEPGLVPADSAAQECRFHAPPVGQALAEGERGGIFRNAQAVFVTDAVAADDGPPLHAGLLAGTAALNLCHGPVTDFLPPTAAEKAAAGALAEEQGPLLFLGKGGGVVADVAGGGGGHLRGTLTMKSLPRIPPEKQAG